MYGMTLDKHLDRRSLLTCPRSSVPVAFDVSTRRHAGKLQPNDVRQGLSSNERLKEGLQRILEICCVQGQLPYPVICSTREEQEHRLHTRFDAVQVFLPVRYDCRHSFLHTWLPPLHRHVCQHLLHLHQAAWQGERLRHQSLEQIEVATNIGHAALGTHHETSALSPYGQRKSATHLNWCNQSFWSLPQVHIYG